MPKRKRFRLTLVECLPPDSVIAALVRLKHTPGGPAKVRKYWRDADLAFAGWTHADRCRFLEEIDREIAVGIKATQALWILRARLKKESRQSGEST